MPIVLLIGALALLFVYAAAVNDSSDTTAPAEDAPGVVASTVAAGEQLVENMTNAVKSLWQLPARAAPYVDTINAASAMYKLPDGLLARTLYQESAFRPEVIDGTVRSSTGATGIAQFMPATAADQGVDPLDPVSSIYGMAKYLSALFKQFGSWQAALAAYNWGPGHVARNGTSNLPIETKNYVANITRDVGLST